MSLVKVWTDIGKKRPVPLIAKIIEKDGPILTIKYLSEGKDKIHAYEEDTYEIEEDSIAEYFRTDDEEQIGFMKVEGGFIHVQDDDDEYIPEDEDEEDSDEEFDDDSDETDEDDMEEEFELDEDDTEDDEDDDSDEDNYVD